MRRLIWDLPLRLFHWLFAGSVVMAFGLAESAEKETPLFYLHVAFGILAGLLLLWRLAWGFVGSSNARWRNMPLSPTGLINYLKAVASGRGQYKAGHNPGGAVTVLAIMVGVTLIIGSGLLITQSEFFEDIHESLPLAVMALVLIHVAGVWLATKMHGEPYVLAMVTGKRLATPAESISHSYRVAAFFMLAIVLGSWFYFLKGFNTHSGVYTAPGTQWRFQIGEAGEDETEPIEEQ